MLDLLLLGLPLSIVGVFTLVHILLERRKQYVGSYAQAWAAGYIMGSPQLQRRLMNRQAIDIAYAGYKNSSYRRY